MKACTKDIVFINNTVAPYRIPLFNKIKDLFAEKDLNMKAVFLCEKETVRKWSVDYDSINFDYEILPNIYQRRNKSTTTSDTIINSGFGKYCFSHIVVLFGYNYLTYLLIMFFRTILLKKTILFCESTLSDKPRTAGVKHKLKCILLKCFFSSYIVPGLESKKFLESYNINPNKITIAENAIAPFVHDNNEQHSENERLNEDYINILYVGRLAKEKNLAFILNNIPQNSGFNYRVIIVGSGPEEAKLKNIETSSLVEFKGYQEGVELAKTFNESDIFILPSSSEPWGLVVNEAINSGLAILVSNKVGCRHELVTDNGQVFELNNHIDFCEKLHNISMQLSTYKANSLKKTKRITINNQAHKMCKAITNV